MFELFLRFYFHLNQWTQINGFTRAVALRKTNEWWELSRSCIISRESGSHPRCSPLVSRTARAECYRETRNLERWFWLKPLAPKGCQPWSEILSAISATRNREASRNVWMAQLFPTHSRECRWTKENPETWQSLLSEFSGTFWRRDRGPASELLRLKCIRPRWRFCRLAA